MHRARQDRPRSMTMALGRWATQAIPGHTPPLPNRLIVGPVPVVEQRHPVRKVTDVWNCRLASQWRPERQQSWLQAGT